MEKHFFSFSPYFSLYLTSLQTAKTIFIKSAVSWLFSSKFISNKYSSPQSNIIDKFWFRILLFRFSHRYQFGTHWLCNHSIIHIIHIRHSVFHTTIFKTRGHGAIFTCDCNNLLKTCFCCYEKMRTRKLTHIPKPYFRNFYRAFTKSNNYVATMLISVILMTFKLWSCWGIHEQFGVFCWCVKAILHSSSWKTTVRHYFSFAPPILLITLVQNFQWINNHIKTCVWKSIEMKLLALKVLWDLDKTS